MYFHLVEGDNDYASLMIECEVLPRVGEEIGFHFAAFDREQWNEDAWNEHKELDLVQWRVLSVDHQYRRNSINSWGSPHVWVRVERVK